jgi:branched-chain amino acid transport system substrate-binding protein
MRFSGLLAGGVSVLAIVLALAVGGCGHPTSSTTTSASVAPSSTTTVTEAVSTTSTTALPPVLRIGALFPLTGELAARGTECVEAMNLAVEEINRAGGIQSLGGVRLEIVQGDTLGDPGNASEEFRRLVEDEGASAVVGAYQSAIALPASETAEELQIPFLVSSGAANTITERGLRYTFRLSPKSEWYARDQVQFLASVRLPDGGPVTKVALLHEDGDFGTETAADQLEYLKAAGIEVVAEIAYPADQADFSTAMIQLKSSDAQAILTATYLSDALLIAAAAKTLRVDIPIIDAGGGTADADFLTRAGTDSESIVSEMEYFPGTSAAQVERDLASASGAALTAAGLYSYQAVWVIANAFERAGSMERERLRLAFATTTLGVGDHMVLPQTLLSFDGQGQNRGATLFQVQVQALRYVVLWPRDFAQAEMALPQ